MKNRYYIGMGLIFASVIFAVLLIKSQLYYSNIEKNGINSTGIISDIHSVSKKGKAANSSRMEGLLTYYVNGWCLREWVEVPVGYRIFNDDPKNEVSIKYDPSNPKACIVTTFYKPKSHLMEWLFTTVFLIAGLFLLPINALLRDKSLSPWVQIIQRLFHWKSLVVLYAFLIIINLTYVPWIKVIEGNKRHLGYNLIWNAPSVSANIDFGRVILVSISITLAALILFILTGLRKPQR